MVGHRLCQLGGTFNKENGAVPTETSSGSGGCGQPSAADIAKAWSAVCDRGIVEPTLEAASSGTGIYIGRTVILSDNRSKPLVCFKEPVWPVWVPESNSGKIPADFEDTWAKASDQARATAKWIATILGVALAALIGSAPLSGIRGKHIPWPTYIIGAAGLACIALTLFLVVRVLVPQITGFEDLLPDKGPFSDLKRRFENNAGILLPLRVCTFAELGGRVRLEALTLDRLENRINDCRGDKKRQAEFKAYCDAQAGRSKWLSYLMQTATQWTVIASYQDVKRRADLARNLGVVSGAVGTALIVVAFLMPTPRDSAVNLNTYKLAHGAATAAAQAAIGNKCTKFRGVVVHTGSNDDVVVLVQPRDVCNSAAITVPGKDLIQVFKLHVEY